MTIERRIINKANRMKSDVLLFRELSGIGSPRAVSGALRKLCASGLLVRIAKGAYARTVAGPGGRKLPKELPELLAEAEMLEKKMPKP